jgi:lipopolysaccharide export system protein LptA
VKRHLRLQIVIVTLLASGIAAAKELAPAQSMLPGQNRDQPVLIEAPTFVVQDNNKKATFSGNVHVVQGDTTIQCESLVLFYGREVGIAQNQPKQPSTTSGPKGVQDIQRIEAHGNVTVATKDQNASGDSGIYDLQSNTITLTGNARINQGQNVIHGKSVVVNTLTGVARVEGDGTTHGTVRALLLPHQTNQNRGVDMTLVPDKDSDKAKTQ